MIYLYQNNREYDYDVRAIALAFFEREKIVEVPEEVWEERLSDQAPEESGGVGRLLFLKLEYGDQRIDGYLYDRTGGNTQRGTEQGSKDHGGSTRNGNEHGSKSYGADTQNGNEHGSKDHEVNKHYNKDYAGEFHEVLECDYSDHGSSRNAVSRFLYRLFSSYTRKNLPWGMLTGIRPTKITMKWLDEGMSPEEIERRFCETYLADGQKAALCCKVAARERAILKSHPFEKEYSLYIGIPFCPTTCLYCSFASFPVSRFGDRMDAYLDALEKELAYVADTCRAKPLTTIYVGGGTPTALDEKRLDRLMNLIHRYFPVESTREFTVEAGRPDSVTARKLEILRDADVGRISINPQTMHQETLDLIGRNHTVDQVKEAYQMAREIGFTNINMDMITGLPGEDIRHVEETLAQLSAMKPESLTVHSLAIKRAAHLNIEMERYQSLVKGSTNDMLRLVDASCSRMGMEPYYMYRQKNIPGNLENIGYSLPGKECLYNILIMEEKQDIISCGAGASTKYVYPEENRIERTENVKNIDHYISRIDEMIERKR